MSSPEMMSTLGTARSPASTTHEASDDGRDAAAAYRARIDRGELAALHGIAVPAGVFDGAGDDDLRLQLRLADAGHFRLLQRTMQTRSRLSAGALSPTSGLDLLCALFLDERRFEPAALADALAAPDDRVHARVALAMSCLHGCALSLLPETYRGRGLGLLSGAAVALEHAGRRDEAASVLLRLASALGTSTTQDLSAAVSHCDRAIALALDESLRFEARAERDRLRWQLGLESIDSPRSAMKALCDEPLPIAPGVRARLLVRVAIDLLGIDPSAQEHLAEGARRSDDLAQRASEFRARMALATHALSRGEMSRSEDHLAVAREVAAGMGFAPGDYVAGSLQIQTLSRGGLRDRALAIAGPLAERLAASNALVSQGSQLATALAQLGDPSAARALLGRLRERLRHARNGRQLAQAESARAAVETAASAFPAAMRHHGRARRLWLLLGDAGAAATQSTSLAQVALLGATASGRPEVLRSAVDAARADLEALPHGEIPHVRASLAQTEGHALFLSGEFDLSNARFLQARDLFASLGEWSQVGFVEGIRGMVCLQAGYHGDSDGFGAADDAFSRAVGLLRDVQPETSDAMLFFVASARFELAWRSERSGDRRAWVDRACEPLAVCWDRLVRRAEDNPLTFDLRSNVCVDGGTLRRRVATLLHRLEGMSAELPDGTLERLRAVAERCGMSDASTLLH